MVSLLMARKFRKYVYCQGAVLFVVLLIWLKLNGGLVPWFLVNERQNGKHNSIHKQRGTDTNLLDFFPKTFGDGSSIIWAHQVNSRQLLHNALHSDAMMIEADVCYRGEGTEQEEDVVIMAHPPDVFSDITLEEWLNVIKDTGKGIKLDFKSTKAVQTSLEILRNRKAEIIYPVVLNADIMQGPGGGKCKVNAGHFMEMVTSMFPHTHLSLGWTTGWDGAPSRLYYDWLMVIEMRDFIGQQSLRQPITFSIRAAFVKNSLTQLKWLCDVTGGTLTIWSDKEDRVSAKDLINVYHKFGKHMAYYDIPDSLNLEFQQYIKAAEYNGDSAVLDQEYRLIHREDWLTSVWGGKGNSIYLGKQSVVMTGEKAWLISKHKYAAKENAIVGRIQLMKKEKSDVYLESGVEIYVRTVIDNPDTVQGVRLYLSVNGLVHITLPNVQGMEKESREISLKVSTSPCFQFELYGVGNQITVHVKSLQTCDSYKHESTLDKGLVVLTLPNNLGAEHYVIIFKASDSSSYVIIDELIVTGTRI